MKKRTNKINIEDYLVINPRPFNMKEWYKAAIELKKAVAKEKRDYVKKKLYEQPEDFLSEDNSN